jgi:biopolymer transport protein ExbD
MANAPSQNRKLTKKRPQDLNIMPIMNMFLVIIPMLLMLMVTVNLAMLAIDYSASSNASANGAGKGKDKKKEKSILTLKIMMDKFQIDFGLKKKKPIDIPVLNEGNVTHYDFLALDKKLKEIKESEKFKDEKTIFVLTDPDVLYDTLIKSIDLCKQDGFTNVKYIAAKTIYLKKK